MGRREQDERPPIEVLGADLGITSSQQVTVGPRRPGWRRGRVLVGVAAVVVVLGGGLFLGDDGERDGEGAAEEERDNSDRTELPKPQTSTTERTTTTRPPTTTTTLPVGPPFGTATPGAVVAFGGSTWVRLDLETGALDEIELALSSPYDVVAAPGGLVGVGPGGEAQYWPVLDASGEVTPLRLGDAHQVFPSERAGEVWLVSHSDPADDTPEVDVRLVDLRGRVQRSFTAAGRWVAGASDDGVVLARGGRIYTADEGGTRPIATGWVVSMGPRAAILQSCDDSGACAITRHPLDGSPARELWPISDPDDVYFEGRESDGAIVLAEHADGGGGATTLRFFDAQGARLGSISEGYSVLPAWLPGALGLVVADGAGLAWLHEDGGTWVRDPLPYRRFASADMLFVVTP